MTPLSAQFQTVEQLNQYIRECIFSAPLLNNLSVKGEISNLRTYTSGHMYFTLKDENSSLPAVMFNYASHLRFQPQNGMKVICFGRVDVYVRDGTYRLYANDIQPDGIGSLAIAFQQLKEKLEKEGLFAPEHRKPIPAFPFRVGLVTAPNGAAVRDLISVIRRRFPAAEIYLSPATVQGQNAPPELIRALRILDENRLCDVIIIGRGGGSMEDLWCFNDESLARAIYACRTPVISAVGHETDFTICDYVADLRAPTPSAGAEKAVPVQADIEVQLKNSGIRMAGALERSVRFYAHRVAALASRPVLASPQAFLNDRSQHLDMLESRLLGSLSSALDQKRHRLDLQREKIKSLNPLSVLKRGFALAVSESGTVLRRAEDLPEGTPFTVRLSSGSVKAVSEGAEPDAPADQP